MLAEPGDLVIDASGLAFVDSSGMRALIRISLRLRDGRLILASAPPQLRRLFEIAGIERGNRIQILDRD